MLDLYIKILRAFILLAVLSLSGILQAADSFKNIRFEGLEKYNLSAAQSFLPAKDSDASLTSDYQTIIRSLFASGYFSDIKLYKDKEKLIIKVKERPWIASFDISGNKLIKDEQIEAILRQEGIEINRSFHGGKFERIVQELKSVYYVQGYYGVQIAAEIKPLANGNVDLAVVVNEGEVSRIVDINLIGNTKFKEKDLLKVFTTRAKYPDSLFDSNEKYLSAALEGDLQRLQNFYQERGYARFKYLNRYISLSPSLEGVFINIKFEEGPLYSFSGSRVIGYEKILLKPTVDELNQVTQGEFFSTKKMNATREEILNRIQSKGYAFARVDVVPTIDDKSKQVFVRFNVDIGKRVYVRNIIFSGNSVTLDKVIRREFRQYEGGLFLPEKLQISETRLSRTGFFSQVSARHQRVNGGFVDIIVHVNERRTGSLNAQLGFSPQLGFTYKASINEGNLLGRGYQTGLSFESNDERKTFNFNLTNPSISNSGGSLSTFLSYSKQNASGSNYIINSLNGGASYGINVTENLRASYGFSYEYNDLQCDSKFTLCQLFIKANYDKLKALSLNFSMSYDLRDRAFFPSQGSYHSFSLEANTPDSQFDLYKLSGQSDFYTHFDEHRRITLRAKLGLNLIDSYSDKDIPFYKNIFLGKLGSMRGFGVLGLTFDSASGLSANTPKGGQFTSEGNLDLYIPLTSYDEFNPNDDNVRLNLFIDSGYVFARAEDFSFGELRYSAGAALVYFTPLGILSFYYAIPLKKKSSDPLNQFGFTISGSL